jgi:DNA-binding Xre family transcriptional regulator
MAKDYNINTKQENNSEMIFNQAVTFRSVRMKDPDFITLHNICKLLDCKPSQVSRKVKELFDEIENLIKQIREFH